MAVVATIANLITNRRRCELIDELGFSGDVVETVELAFQQVVREVRAQSLNIMMSMEGHGKPVFFLEDCAVRFEDLPRLHRPPDPDLRKTRHLRHLVRPLLGRPPACTAGGSELMRS